MSGLGKADEAVNRLLDIVVEEVSLVDRAANQRRFLIVKRSDDMDESTTGAAADDAAGHDEDQDTLGTDPTDPGVGTNDAEGGSALAVALEALEGLTEAVELLGTAADGQARPRLVELAEELRAAALRLAELAGVASPEGDEAGDTAGGESTAAPEPVADAVAAVRATLARVTALVDAGVAAPEKREDSTPPPNRESSPSGEPAPGLPPQVGELTTALRTLSDTVRQQQQRLARLEKRFGLPNSAPAGERPRRSERDEDVSWPLDLNRGLDRESVDKAVSFHDV
jgi:hypothetical protein